MKIYWIKAQAPRRVLALAKHLGVDTDFVEMDGDVVIWEASAIMAYLCNKAGSDMWPASNPAEQVEVLRWLSWNDCHWSPAVAPFYFEHVVKTTFGFGTPDTESLKTKTGDVLRFGKVLDAHLAGRDFAACGRLTIADFQLASMAADWRVSEMPFESFPNIVRWLDGLDRFPAWSHPWPQKARASA
jgi:glutathione S-transferase